MRDLVQFITENLYQKPELEFRSHDLGQPRGIGVFVGAAVAACVRCTYDFRDAGGVAGAGAWIRHGRGVAAAGCARGVARGGTLDPNGLGEPRLTRTAWANQGCPAC